MLTADQLVTDAKLKELEIACKDDRLWAASQPAMPRRGLVPPAGAVEWQVVFRPPTRHEWAFFKQQSGDGANQATKAQAQEMLARVCAVYVTGDDGPVVEAFGRLLDRWPAIPESVGQGLAKIAGFDASLIEK